MNRVILIGRLTRDPELRTTPSGAALVNFTIAVNRRTQTPGQPDADFISCVAWNKTAENMAKYLRKGSQLAVDGRIQTRNYENQQGQRVYVTEVIADNVQFLDSKGSNAGAQANAGYSANNSYGQPNSYGQANPYGQSNPYGKPGNMEPAYDANETLDIASDDLPF
jgi:single-strand DNA-binding protein